MMTTRTTMRCRRLVLTVLAIGAPFGTRQIQAFQCQNYHHAVPIAAVVSAMRHNTILMMMCETREQRSRRQRPAIVLLRMTQESSPPPPLLPRLFQEMIPPTTTTNTTRVTPLFQDQSKPLVRVENNTSIKNNDDESTSERNNALPALLAVGDTVRVVVPDLRGYQIPAKGRGRYEPTTATATTNQVVFVPDPSLQYLILPIGLQGIVEKVYDDPHLSANLPIRVSFVITAAVDDKDNDNSDTTPQPPVNFQMHFAISELALVHKVLAADSTS
jgi:hypothetical protein